MSNKSLTVGLIAVAIIAVGGYFFPLAQSLLGASGTRFPNGVSADSTSPSAGQLRGTTLTTTGAATLASATVTGTLVQSTSDTATTSARVGCIQTTATSTATPVRIVIGSSGATTTYQGGAGIGVVAWQFGTCPI